MKNQRGLSLIELLIAMFIGLFLLAGITSSYIHGKKSSVYQDQYSLIEDNGRIALEIMSKTIQHTGYGSNRGIPISPSKFIQDRPINRTCRGTDTNVLNSNLFPLDSTLDSANGDSIGVVYLGDNEISTDCSGELLPANCQVGSSTSEAAKIYSTFYLDNANRTLRCVGSRDTEIHDIAEGVENMQILYGVNVDDSSDRSVERYVNANDMAGLWNNVTSVQIALLVRSEREILDKAESKQFTLLDQNVTTPNDRHQRAVFTTTVSLRN